MMNRHVTAVLVVAAMAPVAFGAFLNEDFDGLTAGEGLIAQGTPGWSSPGGHDVIVDAVPGMSGLAMDGSTAFGPNDFHEIIFAAGIPFAGTPYLEFNADVSELGNNQEFTFRTDAGNRMLILTAFGNSGNLRVAANGTTFLSTNAFDQAEVTNINAIINLETEEVSTTFSGLVGGVPTSETINTTGWFETGGTEVATLGIFWDGRAVVTDPGFNVDNLVLDIPEPATAGLLVVGGLLMARRRRA